MGWQLPGYTELRELGSGGFGRVVLARHDDSGVLVALKYLAPHLLQDESLRAQFRAEAEMLTRLADPHVTRLYGFEDRPGGAAIVMELVDGISLRAVLTAYGATIPEAALVVLKGSLLGLSAAHSSGVVHRDYKPENVLVEGDGRSKLVDFGIAALAGAKGVAAGTPAYMAPEQWEGKSASPATDVYAATCVFFECVTGHLPYEGGDERTLMAWHCSAPIPTAEIPEPVRPLVAHGMAKRPVERPLSAREFVAELEQAALTGYGPDWEDRGRRRLGEMAVALAALFPMALLSGTLGGGQGTGPGAGAGPAGPAGRGTGAAGGRPAGGFLAKAGIAVLVCLLVLTVGVLVVRQVADDDERPPVTQRSRPPSPVATAGTPLDVGPFTITAPSSWKTIPMRGPALVGQAVDTSGKCTPDIRQIDGGCPGFKVWNRRFGPTSLPVNPYRLEDTHASQFFQNHAEPCPPDTSLHGSGVKDGAKLIRKGTAVIGGRTAQYREWQIPCYRSASREAPGPGEKTDVSYTERDWYVVTSRILVVDTALTPDIDKVLENAKWA